MMRFGCLVAGWLGLFGICGAQAPKGNLPIDLPKDAHVLFQVDAPASDLVPFLGLALASQGVKGTTVNAKTVDVDTPLGTIHLQTKDLVTFLKPIKELHFISYTEDPKDKAIEHYERQFREKGMKRVANVGRDKSLLVMREVGSDGRYLAVMEQGNKVIVVRTDGLPTLGTIGQLALEKLTEAGKNIKDHLKI